MTWLAAVPASIRHACGRRPGLLHFSLSCKCLSVCLSFSIMIHDLNPDMQENLEELAMLESLDNGKPLSASKSGDLPQVQDMHSRTKVLCTASTQ